MIHRQRYIRTAHYVLRALGVLFLLTFAHVARADVAPPEQPPGSSIDPGKETQVRMVAERVVLDVQGRPLGDQRPSLAGDTALAQVNADFQMRNLGSDAEHLQVRFPLGDPNGQGSGFGEFPQVQNFAASVSGQSAITTIITSTNPQGADQPPVQWAAFDVDFPVEQDVPISVTYTITPTGYFPKARFAYVLQTGAGWRDTIGSADIIVRLPYAANEENVFLNEGETSAGSQLVGNEIRWHRDDLEPNAQDNIVASIVVPSVWQTILQNREAVAANPQDAEALTHLALAYESAVTSRFPTDEHDPFAALSEQTFAQAVAQQPDSASLHANFAALLFQHLTVQASLPPDDPNVQRILAEVSTALALDPQNAQAKDVYAELQQSVEGGSLPLATPATSPMPSPAPTEVASTSASPGATAEPTSVPSSPATSATEPLAPSATVAAVALQSTAIGPTATQTVATLVPTQDAEGGISPLLLGAIGLAVLIVAIGVVALRRRA